MKINAILPLVLATLTGYPRYRPEIIWSRNSFVHNFFRLYELIFGRRIGIRAEISSGFDGKTLVQQAHSFEGSCALIETAIRHLFHFRFPVKIWVPVLSSPEGLPVPMFMFAIAHDADDAGAISTSNVATLTISHTCTGSNLVLASQAQAGGTAAVVTGVTYNGVSMTSAQTQSNSDNSKVYLHYLANPATGAHNLVSSYSPQGNPVYLGGTSFSGANTSSPLGNVDAWTPDTTARTSISHSFTTAFANSMIVDGIVLEGSTAGESISVTGTGQTLGWSQHNVGAGAGFGAGSWTPTTTAGSYTIGWSWTPNTAQVLAGMEIRQFVVAASFPPMLKLTQAVKRAAFY